MKIDLLKTVMEEASQEISRDGLTCRKYYHFDNKWFDLETKEEVNSDDGFNLMMSEFSNEYYSSKEKTAWYHVREHSAGISIRFNSPARTEKRKKYHKLIDSLVKNATNSYNVSHNSLTGLFSREHFRKLILDSLEQFKSSSSSSQSETASEVQDQTSISLLAFDIDKFKQVNDTYGHLYGDQVLKCFAMRLEEVKQEIQSTWPNQIRIELAHPSGEEFFALIVANTSEEEVRAIAERFREKITELNLPSDAEWKVLNKKDLEKIVLPPLYERKVTTSVGVANFTGFRAESTPEADMLSLFDKADIALYRSKAGGRNRVTLSSEILQKCGKVLEHDENTGVIAIDIGRDAGVLVGQEFRVYPPRYTGVTPYIDDDGRSKKTLGFYPKVEIGRVVVFNSQKDMSFAVISPTNKSRLTNIVKDSMLEAVPLGHITHLIENPQDNLKFGIQTDAPSVLGWKDFQDYLVQLNNDSKEIYAAVFKFRYENDFLQRYGSASLNRALAQLYSDVKKLFGYNVRVGVIDKTSVCVVGEGNDFPESDVIDLMLAQSNKEELMPVCGYYISDDFDDLVSSKDALEFARFTVSNSNVFEKTRINKFSLELAETIIGDQRSSQAYRSAIADFIRLREMGITSGTLENHVGLCYLQLKDISGALESFDRAIEHSPDNLIYRSNYITMAYRLKEYEKGLEALSKYSEEDIDRMEKLHSYGFITYAYLLERGADSSSQYYDKSRFIKIASKAIKMPDAQSRSDLWMITQALDKAKNNELQAPND